MGKQDVERRGGGYWVTRSRRFPAVEDPCVPPRSSPSNDPRTVVPPADANETAGAWGEILRRGPPAGLALSRQNLPVIDRTEHAKATGVTKGCPLYTSDAADERSSVDLGGRRIINKKKKTNTHRRHGPK